MDILNILKLSYDEKIGNVIERLRRPRIFCHRTNYFHQWNYIECRFRMSKDVHSAPPHPYFLNMFILTS